MLELMEGRISDLPQGSKRRLLQMANQLIFRSRKVASRTIDYSIEGLLHEAQTRNGRKKIVVVPAHARSRITHSRRRCPLSAEARRKRGSEDSQIKYAVRHGLTQQRQNADGCPRGRRWSRCIFRGRVWTL